MVSETQSWGVAWIKGKYHLPDYKLTFQIFKIPYMISGGEVEKIQLSDIMGGGLIAEIKTNQDGVFVINVPRNLPYSNYGFETDEPFIVLSDGEEVRVEHEKTKCFWVLSIPFKKGSQNIEIIGTFNLGSDPIRSLSVPPDCVITPSPLQQITGGVLPEDVVCKDGLEVIFKSKDDSPVCVKPQTAQNLLERGSAFYAKDTITTKEKTWVSKYPINCIEDLCYIHMLESYYNSTNLQTEPLGGNLQGVGFNQTSEFIIDYFAKRGIEVSDVRYNLVQTSSCEAYECWDKYRLDLLVSDSDLADVYNHGYKITDVLIAMMPK